DPECSAGSLTGTRTAACHPQACPILGGQPWHSLARFILNWLQVLLIVLTSCNVRRKRIYLRLVQLWSVRAKQAVIMRIPSQTPSQCGASFSNGTTLGY